MTLPPVPTNASNVAGIDTAVPAPSQNPELDRPAPGPQLQDRLAGWVSDLTTLHELTDRLVRTTSVAEALDEVLRAGAALVGARRGMVVLEAADGPGTTVGLGLSHGDLGRIETVPRAATACGRVLDALAAAPAGSAVPAGCQPDLFADPHLDPRHREVATALGYAAAYAVPLAAGDERLGAVAWLYDEPAEPGERARHLTGLYCDAAAHHLARTAAQDRALDFAAALREELLPSRLPRVSGVQLAARHRTGPRGGGDWYDALPLPEGALGLAVGSVTGSGPGAVAAMGRLRASLRAYAVMEGEDPVAVLSDLELLLRLTEPARSATALFAYVEPGTRRCVVAGAGHVPPMIIGERRAEFVETTVSAPLGMLSCWEAPSVIAEPASGETLLLCTDGLLRRTGEPVDRAYARLHTAAASVPRAARHDPGAVCDHILRSLLPDGTDAVDSDEDVVLLAARFR
ncbi:PP2C family protein-serine/threonine phosphatase [Streptomyces sp. NPDC060194]|uniref:PP2C family protein-serine/threonine phosphatase n=1 Tax=Streptomyces sp. NPDC060194 TaxID=3347069 RepID=UPI0036680C12